MKKKKKELGKYLLKVHPPYIFANEVQRREKQQAILLSTFALTQHFPIHKRGVCYTPSVQSLQFLQNRSCQAKPCQNKQHLTG